MGPVLSRRQRLERLQRTRRRVMAQDALESLAWIAGSAAVAGLVLAGLVGFH